MQSDKQTRFAINVNIDTASLIDESCLVGPRARDIYMHMCAQKEMLRKGECCCPTGKQEMQITKVHPAVGGFSIAQWPKDRGVDWH